MKKGTSSQTTLPAVTISELNGVRYLHLGTDWVQGAMRIRSPLTLELEYVQNMMVWTLMRPESELQEGLAVQLGLGASAITRFCHQALRMHTLAIELNLDVIRACRMFFRLPENSPTLEVRHMDAEDFVADPRQAGQAHVLCVDLYDHEAASPVLDSEIFYGHCHRTLADGGVMTVNLFGRDASFERSKKLIANAFGPAHVHSIGPTKEGNMVVCALKNRTLPDQAALLERAKRVEHLYKLPATKWVRMIHNTTLENVP